MAEAAIVVLISWALWERHKRHETARRLLATAARLHESQRNVRVHMARCDMLLTKQARLVTKIENLTQTATEVAMLAQLDSLWQDVRRVDDVPVAAED